MDARNVQCTHFAPIYTPWRGAGGEVIITQPLEKK